MSQLRLALADEPAAALMPPRTLAAKNATSAVYDAGSLSKRTLSWRPPTARPNDLLNSLSTIRDRSRAAARNDGHAKGSIEKLVTNLIGTGIKPLSQVADSALRAQIQALWLRWTDESDADGLLDFYGQQALVTRGWLEGGDMFARLRLRLPTDGLSVPLQLQLLEPELCPHTYNGIAKNGNRIRAGIEFDALGRRTAYYFYRTRPELDDFDTSDLRRVPADTVIHLYNPERSLQLRGLPILTQALLILDGLQKLGDAALLRQQIANLFSLFVKRPAAPTDAGDIDPLTGQTKESGAIRPAVEWDPGLVQELYPGEEVEFSDPPDAGNGLAEFMKLQLRAVCVSTGVPYEVLTGDMSGMNDRTVRVVLNEFKRRMQMLQHSVIVYKFCRPVWSAWLYRAFLAGALPLPADFLDAPEPYAGVKWIPPRWAYLHPVQDVEADKAAIRAGFTSRAAVVSEYGEDAEMIDAEQAADNARADGLGLTYDSDSRTPASGQSAALGASLVEGQPAPAGATQ